MINERVLLGLRFQLSSSVFDVPRHREVTTSFSTVGDTEQKHYSPLLSRRALADSYQENHGNSREPFEEVSDWELSYRITTNSEVYPTRTY